MDTKTVDGIVNELNHLSAQSATLDNGLDQLKRTADGVVSTYGANFSLVNPIPSQITSIRTAYQVTLWDARDMASGSYITHLSEFVSVKLAMVEMVQTDQDRQDAMGALNDTIAEKDPVKEKPLPGFDGVTKTFGSIWTSVSDEAKRIVGILEAATDPEKLKKAIERLEVELVPVKEGCEKIKEALKKFATGVH